MKKVAHPYTLHIYIGSLRFEFLRRLRCVEAQPTVRSAVRVARLALINRARQESQVIQHGQ